MLRSYVSRYPFQNRRFVTKIPMKIRAFNVDKARIDIRKQDSIKGVAVAALVLTNWTLAFQHAMWNVDVNSIIEYVPALMWLEFATTGLFITAHDSMHGSVSPVWPEFNRFIGTLCALLYAGFWMPKDLAPNHAKHHISPGIYGADPDFYDQGIIGWRWFIGFMREYFSIQQLIRLQVASLILMYGLGASSINMTFLWAPAGLLSALRLWYFGTAVPHECAPDIHSTKSRPIKAFLECYGFGYHKEHHDDPSIPWWKLLNEKYNNVKV